jgi:hypothetical protein
MVAITTCPCIVFFNFNEDLQKKKNTMKLLCLLGLGEVLGGARVPPGNDFFFSQQ